jgi:hypothetical protein
MMPVLDFAMKGSGAEMTLDLAVSRAALLSSTLVAALHSERPWFIEIGGLRVPAERVTGPDSVAFFADFPEVCFLIPPEQMLLWEDDILRSVKPLVSPGRVQSIVWEFEVDPAGRVAA